PDIAGHLTAAKGAVTGRKGTNVDTAQEARVQIGVLWSWWCIAPGITALMGGNARAISGRLGTGGEVPLSLSWHPPASPVTVRFSLIPRHVRHRGVRLHRHQGIEVLPQPLLPMALPIERVLRLGLGAPDPALITPPVTPLIAPIVYKRGKFRVGYG